MTPYLKINGLELKMTSAKDPSNPNRTKWAYWVKMEKKKIESFYRVSRETYYLLKRGALTIADIRS